MSLPAAQQRILDGIADGLRRSEPKLAAMYAIFTRLCASEGPPRRSSWPWPVAACDAVVPPVQPVAGRGGGCSSSANLPSRSSRCRCSSASARLERQLRAARGCARTYVVPGADDARWPGGQWASACRVTPAASLPSARRMSCAAVSRMPARRRGRLLSGRGSTPAQRLVVAARGSCASSSSIRWQKIR